MERKKVVVDLEQIDLLEQRVVKATELIRALRRERDVARTRLQETQQALEQLQGASREIDRDRQELRTVSEQLEVLQEERLAIRGRVTRMLELMSSLDEASVRVHGDH